MSTAQNIAGVDHVIGQGMIDAATARAEDQVRAEKAKRAIRELCVLVSQVSTSFREPSALIATGVTA